MLSFVLSNVPASTSDLLSYSMLIVVGAFLVSGPSIVYYYYRKNKRMKAPSPTPSV